MLVQLKTLMSTLILGWLPGRKPHETTPLPTYYCPKCRKMYTHYVGTNCPQCGSKLEVKRLSKSYRLIQKPVTSPFVKKTARA